MKKTHLPKKIRIIGAGLAGCESAWQFRLDLCGLGGGGSPRPCVSTTARRVPSDSSGDVVPPRVPEIPDTLAEGDPVASPPVRVEPGPPPPPRVHRGAICQTAACG